MINKDFEELKKEIINEIEKQEKQKKQEKEYIKNDNFNINKQPLINIGIIGHVAHGKCFKKDTKIIMYDGSIKCIQDVNIGEYIMGDDSTPRKVLSICKGNDIMYKIKNKLDESYVVNSDHILSLKYTIFKQKDSSIEFSVKKFFKK